MADRAPQAPIALPPIASPRTALVYLHAQSGGDFFADVPFTWAAGELRAMGWTAEVWHVWLERDRPDVSRHRLDALVEALRAGGHHLVVFEHLWQPELLGRLQRELGALVCLTGAFDEGGTARVDFRLAHFDNHRQPLLDLVGALATGGDLRQIANLRIHLAHMAQPAWSLLAPQPHPATPDALRPFCPVTDARHIGVAMDAQGEAPPVRKTLDTNKGCPFADDVADNPAFAGVALDAPDLRRKGCAFCPMGGDYRALPWRETVRTHLDQVAWYQQSLPQLDEVVLRDQHALRYLPELIEGALSRGLRPFGVLVPGRGDAILRFGEQMARAAALAEGTGMWFCIYLVGFESFSQAQLDLYNKGVRVAEYAEALRQMRALHARHPDGFRLYAYAAASFVLFNPWTQIEDLAQTADFCTEHAVGAMAHGMLRSRLRLYPELPLYWKARADGLLRDGSAPADRGAAFAGYGAEAPWLYRDGRLAVIEALLLALAPHVRPDEEVGLLRAVLRWGRRALPQPLAASAAPDPAQQAMTAALAAEVIALRALWRPESVQPGPSGSAAARPDPRIPAPAAIERALAQRRQRAHAAVQARAERVVLLGQGCNNRCQSCVAGHAQHDVDLPRLLAQVERAARTHGEVAIAGREPTLIAGLPRLLRGAVRAGARRVELLSNGRALAGGGVCARLQAAGLSHVVLKRHRLGDGDEDAYTQAPGAGAQLWQALVNLRAESPKVAVSLLLIATAAGHQELAALVHRGADLGVRGVQLRVPAAELDLGRTAAMAHSLREARGTAEERGLFFGIEGF